jgi:hypothetical protein
MKFTVQLVAWTDNGQEETRQEVAVLEKESERGEHLGLTLAEAKQLLKRLQHYLVERQTTSYLVARARCEACGRALLAKEQLTRTIRTLFGTVVLRSPRLYHCRCRARTATTFRPLRALLPDSTTPELLFLETKWASLISYGLTARVLKDFLPLDETLTATTVQNHTLAIAQRCEEELGEEQQGAVDGCPGDPGPSSRPKGPVAVGLDGGYVESIKNLGMHLIALSERCRHLVVFQARVVNLPPDFLMLSTPRPVGEAERPPMLSSIVPHQPTPRPALPRA